MLLIEHDYALHKGTRFSCLSHVQWYNECYVATGAERLCAQHRDLCRHRLFFKNVTESRVTTTTLTSRYHDLTVSFTLLKPYSQLIRSHLISQKMHEITRHLNFKIQLKNRVYRNSILRKFANNSSTLTHTRQPSAVISDCNRVKVNFGSLLFEVTLFRWYIIFFQASAKNTKIAKAKMFCENKWE